MNHAKTLIIFAAMSLMLVTGSSYAEDAILKQAVERCAQFETDVRDIRVMQLHIGRLGGDLTTEETIYAKGGKSRVEMKMPPPFKTWYIIDDSTTLWVMTFFDGKGQQPRNEVKDYTPVPKCRGFFADNARVTGSDSVQGRDCHVVELVDEGVSKRLWLDKSNYFPVQEVIFDSTGAETSRLTHSDFRTLLGSWEYPYLTQTYHGDTLKSTATVTAVEVNQGISDELFDADKVGDEYRELIPKDSLKTNAK